MDKKVFKCLSKLKTIIKGVPVKELLVRFPKCWYMVKQVIKHIKSPILTVVWSLVYYVSHCNTWGGPNIVKSNFDFVLQENIWVQSNLPLKGASFK